MQCTRCRSYAINHHCHGRDGSDPDLCDVCYWRKRAEPVGVGAAQQVVVYIQSDHLQKAMRAPHLCRVEPTQRLPDFVPLFLITNSAKSKPQEGRMP